MTSRYDERYSEDFENCFQYFWEKIVLPTLESVLNEADSDFKEAVGFGYAYGNLDEYKQNVKRYYREKRQWLKNYYLPHEDTARLDQHKIGAVWCRTLLANKPFAFDAKAAVQFIDAKFPTTDVYPGSGGYGDNSAWFVKNVYANYRAAYLVSLGIVYCYLVYDCSEKGNDLPDYLRDGGYEYFKEKGRLRCPLPRKGHTDFTASCIIALMKNDINHRDFDYLSYATVLYQIEYYNKTCYYMLKNGLKI